MMLHFEMMSVYSKVGSVAHCMLRSSEPEWLIVKRTLSVSQQVQLSLPFLWD